MAMEVNAGCSIIEVLESELKGTAHKATTCTASIPCKHQFECHMSLCPCTNAETGRSSWLLPSDQLSSGQYGHLLSEPAVGRPLSTSIYLSMCLCIYLSFFLSLPLTLPLK